MNSQASSRKSGRSASPVPQPSTGRVKKRKGQSQQHPQPFSRNESLAHVSSALDGMVETPVLSTFEKDILLDRLKKEIVRRFSLNISPKKSSRKLQETKFILGGKAVASTRNSNNNSPIFKRTTAQESTDHEGNVTVSEKIKVESIGKNRSELSKLTTTPSDVQNKKDVSIIDTVKRRMKLGTNQCTRVLESSVSGAGPTPLLILLSRDVRPPTIMSHIPLLAKKLGVPLILLPGRASRELGDIFGGKTVATMVFLENVNQDGKDQELPKEIVDCHRVVDSFVEFAIKKVPS